MQIFIRMPSFCLHLKGQPHEICTSDFFHQITSPGPIRNVLMVMTLKFYQIFLQFFEFEMDSESRLPRPENCDSSTRESTLGEGRKSSLHSKHWGVAVLHYAACTHGELLQAPRSQGISDCYKNSPVLATTGSCVLRVFQTSSPCQCH